MLFSHQVFEDISVRLQIEHKVASDHNGLIPHITDTEHNPSLYGPPENKGAIDHVNEENEDDDYICCSDSPSGHVFDDLAWIFLALYPVVGQVLSREVALANFAVH